MANFDLVWENIGEAKAITWDTCHKIYLLMDNEQVAEMRELEYDPIITAEQMTPNEMLETIKRWFDESCALRFVSAVSTMPDGEDANLGFETLIGQFEEEDCEDCGERGCKGVCADFEDDDEEEDDDDEEDWG
jgi:hypothetical protein